MNQPKHDLLVFSKKEVLVVLALLFLVALFSFTIGLNLGKDLGGHAAGSAVTHETPPLAEPQHEAPAADVAEAEAGHDAHGAAAKAPATATELPHSVDARLAQELKQEKITSTKPVTSTLPTEKRHSAPAIAFTLQVGSYKNVAEAAERVAVLKRAGFNDAFYFEASVPEKGTWYRVGLGRYETKAAAEHAGKTLKAGAHGDAAPSFIVQKLDGSGE